MTAQIHHDSISPALADMPSEGHGVLIAPQWIVTAAHAVTWQAHIKQVVVNGLARDVEKLVIHPGYKNRNKRCWIKRLQLGIGLCLGYRCPPLTTSHS
ncbi:MAG: trypsin-like serine protease [Gammaproteobacteria bacterium]|nr:trypsin-like serine protease [Gammaproteobacteria bacterium]